MFMEKKLFKKVSIILCFTLLSLFFSFHILNAQVTYQNNVRDNGDANSPSVSINNFTIPAGSNRLLVVFVGASAPGSAPVTAITYNNQNLMPATAVTSTSERSEIWYLVISGTSSITSNVFVSWSNVVSEGQAIAASFGGVDASSPIGMTENEAGVGNTTLATLSSSSGNMVVDCVQNRNNTNGVNFGANQTEIFDLGYTSTQTGVSYQSVSGSPVDMSWSVAISDRYAYSVAELRQATILPTELKYFLAKPNPQSVTLDWATVTEVNNDYFTIERSVNGIHFEPIGEVKGAGTSDETLTYTFKDISLPQGRNQLYYRLRQTDFDGRSKVEKVVSVDLTSQNLSEQNLLNFVTVYPNPTADILNIRFPENMVEDHVEIYNEWGQKVLETFLNHPSKNAILLEDFPSGVYFLNFKINGENFIKEVVVSK